MAKKVIGLDIGGSKITGVLFDGKKEMDFLTIVTPKNLFEFERNILKLVDFLSAKTKVSAVGVGMAGLINAKKGIAVYSPNIKFIHSLNFNKLFKANGIKNIKVDNDTNCFTRSELYLGQGKKYKNFLGLILGTGVGGGIVIDGKIYRGHDNSGAEFGHALIEGDYFEQPYQKLRDRRDFKAAGRLIGKMMASLTNIFAPEAIIIGGGFGHNEAKKYLPSAKSEMKKFLFNKNSSTKILISKLKNPGALGAALLMK